ncbi:MAG TPA: threonine ammonia-lyase [Solirubrobacterales bacterium]|nr:threonine ammonia-lyase [Solirubrobacterales bacterium]
MTGGTQADPRAWQPSLAELEEVHRGCADLVKETPVFSFGELSRRCGGRIVLKAENLQRTGSFKLRGSLTKLRRGGEEGRAGVVAGSAGNHGQALAYAARAQGIPCTVFMPERAPVSKVDAVAGLGAEVELGGSSVDECVEAAREMAAREGMLLVHPFDDLDVVRGQSGVGIELLEQVEDLAKVVVPVGGGGLISGIAAALRLARPEVEIVGVQAAGCAPFVESLRQGEPVPAPHPATIADGIAIKRPGEVTLPLVERWVDEMVTVDDDSIAEAMVLLAERAKLVTEGAGAAAVAALSTGAVEPAASGATVPILSGGNVDAHVLAGVINRHQTAVGRRARLFTRISDRPGGLAGLLETVAAAGGNVLDVTHVRDGVSLHVEETGVELLIESRSGRHHRALVERMEEAGYVVEEQGGD